MKRQERSPQHHDRSHAHLPAHFQGDVDDGSMFGDVDIADAAEAMDEDYDFDDDDYEDLEGDITLRDPDSGVEISLDPDDLELDGDPGFFGDMYVGDMFGESTVRTMRPMKRRKRRGGSKIRRGALATVRAKKFGKFLPQAQAVGKMRLRPEAKAALSAIASVPGAVASQKSFSPIVINNGRVNQAPTRGMLPGALLVNTLQRFETQYPGTTRTQTAPAASGSQTFTFAAPTAAEGGSTLVAPMIFIQLSTQRQFSIAAAQISVYVNAVAAESGNAVDARAWTVILGNSATSCFLCIIPFIEVSSSVYPALIRANGTPGQECVIELDGIPANTNVRAILPAADSKQFQEFKTGFGISLPIDRLAR